MEKEIKDRVIDLFTQIAIFTSFSTAEIKTKFFRQGLAKIVEYDAAETIIAEGKYDNWVFWLIDGQIDVVKNNCRVATFQRVGDMFGEMGILEGDARSASVYAGVPTVCLCIDMSILDHPELEAKIDKETFCRDVAQVTKNRLAKTTSRLTETENTLAAVAQKLQEEERKHAETLQTLKKTLEKLDEKDKIIAALQQKLADAGHEG
ncbi:cyclic nucleotide-binding domain-containing protein [Thermodesulfobacteriota bacterium]